MAIYSSYSKNGFWDDTLGQPPKDGCLITDEQHQEYLEAQTEGKVIDFSTSPPSLTDPSPLVVIEGRLADVERRWRNGHLAITDGVVARHRDELEEGIVTTLTAEQYRDVQRYRRQLREWPQSERFPEMDYRPIAPSWMVEKEQ
ncbi:phage tail protein [Pseudomonas sp. NPDC089569]|uniref:phage tail protein n=1 Tax=Pseudomonas sp. NPDC089569 TaxID=3390722 RepID=UPI003D07DD19